MADMDWIERRLPMYRAGIDEEQRRLRRLETSVRIRKTKMHTMLQVRRRRRSSEAISPSEPRFSPFSVTHANASPSATSEGQIAARMNALVVEFCSCSEPKRLGEVASALTKAFQIAEGQQLLSEELSKRLVPRSVVLLASADPTTSPHFHRCLILLNELLNHAELSGHVSVTIMQRELEIVLTRILLLGSKFNFLKETAMLTLGNCAAYFACCGSSHTTPRSLSSTKDLGRIISSVPGAVDAFRGLILQVTSPSLQSLTLWVLANILDPKGQRCPSSREAARRFSMLMPALLSCCATGVRPPASQVATPNAPSTPSNRAPSSLQNTSLRALMVIEALTRFGGSGLKALVDAQSGIGLIVSLLHSSSSSDEGELVIAALKIIRHIFEGTSQEGIMLCLKAGSLDVLCQILRGSSNTEVRYLAVSAIHDFLLCPCDIVFSEICSYSCGFSGDTAPVISTLLAKCQECGDVSLRVREKAISAILNLALHNFIDENIKKSVAGCFAGVLENQTAEICARVVASLDILFSSNKATGSTPRVVLHEFEVSGGLEALDNLLSSAHVSQDVEQNIEQLLSKYFPSTQGTSMDLDDEENNNNKDNLPLTMIFADTISSSGRLW